MVSNKGIQTHYSTESQREVTMYDVSNIELQHHRPPTSEKKSVPGMPKKCPYNIIPVLDLYRGPLLQQAIGKPGRAYLCIEIIQGHNWMLGNTWVINIQYKKNSLSVIDIFVRCSIFIII